MAHSTTTLRLSVPDEEVIVPQLLAFAQPTFWKECVERYRLPAWAGMHELEHGFSIGFNDHSASQTWMLVNRFSTSEHYLLGWQTAKRKSEKHSSHWRVDWCGTIIVQKRGRDVVECLAGAHIEASKAMHPVPRGVNGYRLSTGANAAEYELSLISSRRGGYFSAVERVHFGGSTIYEGLVRGGFRA